METAACSATLRSLFKLALPIGSRLLTGRLETPVSWVCHLRTRPPLFADLEGGELAGDAAVNFNVLTKTDVPVGVFGDARDAERLAKLLEGAAWIVDALLGTGARGEPRAPYDEVIEQINAAAAPCLAVDLPSGLDCDTGRPATHTIRAAETCTFLAAKPGFFQPEAAPYIGRLHVCDIGVPRKLIEQASAHQQQT